MDKFIHRENIALDKKRLLGLSSIGRFPRV